MDVKTVFAFLGSAGIFAAIRPIVYEKVCYKRQVWNEWEQNGFLLRGSYNSQTNTFDERYVEIEPIFVQLNKQIQNATWCFGIKMFSATARKYAEEQTIKMRTDPYGTYFHQ